MYGLSARFGKQATYIPIVACICLGFILVITAGLIVVALIPVYLPKESVTPNDNAFTSQERIMIISVEKNSATVAGRRRRAVGDLSEYTPGIFEVEGIAKIREKLAPVVIGNQVKDISITNATLTKINQRRRRRVLSKRQSYSGAEIVLTIKFRIIYQSTCLANCQTKFAPTITNRLYNIQTTSLELTQVQIRVGGVSHTVTTIKFISVLYVSQILPGSNPSTDTIPVFSINSTTTTTTTTTPSVTGPLG